MDTDPNSGHRQRLRERFLKTGIASLSEHEILELLLSYAIPRKDTKPPAKALLRRFTTLSGVLHADSSEMAQIDGMGKGSAAFLSLVKDVSGYCLAEAIDGRSALTHRRDVEAYLRVQYGQRSDEYIAALYLDNANRILATEVVAEGTVNQCALYPRAVVERALKYKAGSFILAHNHPGGSINPSAADWQITQRLHEIGALLDIPLLDHVIVCRDRVVSMRELPNWPRPA